MPTLRFKPGSDFKPGSYHAVIYKDQPDLIKVLDSQERDTENVVRFSFLDKDGGMILRCSGRIIPAENRIEFVEGLNWDASWLADLVNREPQPISS